MPLMVCENRRPWSSKRARVYFLAWKRRWILEFGSGSSKAERGALIMPAKRGQARLLLAAHDQIDNLSPLRRDHVTAAEHRAARMQTFRVWAEISSVAITIMSRPHTFASHVKSR